ncbi:uncharacterized protein [Amphiura filiformis]|uniref:uncharacterized protein n=1 Tax=Amphiura filiformis TaxID=82378 RepID=UPI003B211942
MAECIHRLSQNCLSQSKIKDVEPSNINGLLQSLKDVPKPKPPSKVDQTPPRSPRKVTDDEVADALRFLLGRGGRVPRTRSAMDLRDESARKLRGEDKTGSRTFVLAMMPDGTQRRVSVDRRSSLGNDLDSDDQINLVGEALRELTPGTYQRKLPKNDFDGREERPPTPRDSSSSTSSVSSNEDNTAAKPNQDSSDRDEDFNSKDYPINNVDDDDTLASVSEEEDKTQKEELDVVTPSSYKPNEDKIDLSNLYKLRPDGGTDLPTESSSKPLVTVPVTIDELVDNLPIFDSESESDEDANLQEHKNILIMEADIHASAAVIPEESSVDLNILESEPPVSLPVDETRSPSSSDASSRSTLRPHGSSDASSRSSEWQEDTEDEIIPESKVSTESSPDLTSLEKLRPEGIEAPHLGDDDTAPSKETSNMPTERSGATVKDLEYILPALESSSDSDEEVNEHDEQLYPVDEEPLNPIKVNPDNAQIDLSNLDKTDSDLENDEGDESRPYDVSDILDDLSSTEEDWPVPPESPVQQDWPAPPDDDMHYSGIHDQKFDNEDYDLPPPPPPDTRSSSRSSMSSPENRVPSFMAVEAPKRPVSRGSSSKSSPSSTSSLGKDPKTKKPSEPEPPAIVITASSDDFRHTDESDEDVLMKMKINILKESTKRKIS